MRKRLDSRKMLTLRQIKRRGNWKRDMKKKWSMNNRKRWRLSNTRKRASNIMKTRMNNMNSRSRSSTLVRKWRLKRRRNRSQSNSSKLMIDSRCSNRTQEKSKIKWNMSQKRLAPTSTMMQRNE